MEAPKKWCKIVYIKYTGLNYKRLKAFYKNYLAATASFKAFPTLNLATVVAATLTVLSVPGTQFHLRISLIYATLDEVKFLWME